MAVVGSGECLPGVGLSFPHICTQGAAVSVADGDGGGAARVPGREDRCSVSVWDGGSMLKVSTPLGRRGGGRRGAVAVEVDAGAADDVEEERRGPRSGGGLRGRVKGFSRASRLRLLELVNKLRQEEAARCLFVTLTLSDDCDTSGRALKLYLKRFKMRLSRKFPNVSMIWRLEVVARKSGKHVGLPFGHFHILLFGVPDAPGLRDWLSHTWFECVGSGDRKHLLAGTNLEVPRSWGAVKKYASKELYAAKAGDDELAEQIPDIGRFWGVLEAERLPMAPVVIRWLEPGEAFKLLRVMRGYVRSVWRSRKKRAPSTLHRWRSFFVGDGSQWAERLAVKGYLI